MRLTGAQADDAFRLPAPPLGMDVEPVLANAVGRKVCREGVPAKTPSVLKRNSRKTHSLFASGVRGARMWQVSSDPGKQPEDKAKRRGGQSGREGIRLLMKPFSHWMSPELPHLWTDLLEGTRLTLHLPILVCKIGKLVTIATSHDGSRG